MRQDHRAGEKLFVDYAGQTVAVVDPETGEARPAQVFVAVMGASNYDLRRGDLVAAPCRLDRLARAGHGLPGRRAGDRGAGQPEVGGAPGAPVRAAAEPHLPGMGRALRRGHPARAPGAAPGQGEGQNRACCWWSAGSWPACATAGSSRWPNSTRRSRGLLRPLNDRPLRKLPGSRRSLYESLDRPAMRPLPARPYTFAEWRTVRVHIDYHVEVDGHYYSVPYQLVKQQLDARFTANTVEVFHKGRRVASHRRAHRRGRHTTVARHMPASHRAHAEWTPQRLVRWAERSGPATAELIGHVLATRVHPQHGFRSCLGIMRPRPAVTATRAWRPPAAAPWRWARMPTRASNRS